MKPMLSLLFLAFLAGCSVHQAEPIAPAVSIPDSYLENAVQASAPSLQPWWQVFDDADLNRLMRQVFADNFELSQAVARWRQAEAAVRSVNAGRRPHVTLEGQAGRQRQMTFLGPVTGDYYGLSVAAGFEVDLWKRLASQVEAAHFEHQAAAADVDALCLSLSARLADLYFTAVEQRAQQKLLERTIASYRDILERVERRYRGGIVPALDVYQARQNLAAARARLPQVEARLAAAEHGVAVLQGRYPERHNTGRLTTLPSLDEDYPAGLPSQLLNSRPDVQAALLRVRAADRRVASAIADRFPAFNLVETYGGAADAPRRMFDSPNIFWNLLVNLTQPLLDGGQRRAEVERRQALFEELLAGYQARVLEAFREVEDALAAERATRAQVQRLEERRVSTAAALRLATDRYLLGVSEYLPVLTAQVLHLETESSLLAARRQMIADRISLGRSLGGRWMMVQRQQAGRVPAASSNEDNP